MITNRLQNKLNQPTLDEALLQLLELNHPTWDAPLYFVNSLADVVSQGRTYKGKIFSCTIPPQTKNTIGQVTLRLIDIDRVVAKKLLGMTDRRPGSAKLMAISSGAPDVIEVGPISFEFTSPLITASDVTMQLGAVATLSEIYPVHKIRPSTHPGAFEYA